VSLDGAGLCNTKVMLHFKKLTQVISVVKWPLHRQIDFLAHCGLYLLLKLLVSRAEGLVRGGSLMLKMILILAVYILRAELGMCWQQTSIGIQCGVN
jgi:hypothetical protein